MLRANADVIITNISKEFSDNYYLAMAKRGRGVSFVENVNVNSILIDDLRTNEYAPIMTDEQRNNLINKLI